MSALKFQPDYWIGDKCVENEVPWITPDSARYLETLCRPTDTVLEIGTGGSTLFFARRCASVIAVETDEAFFRKMSQVFHEKNLTNISYILIQDQEHLEEFIGRKRNIDIASVDSVYSYDRSKFLDKVLVGCQGLSTLVLDNYAADCLFLKHYDWSINRLITHCPGPIASWAGQDFDDPHWIGRGTRILTTRGERALAPIEF